MTMFVTSPASLDAISYGVYKKDAFPGVIIS
jgi:hypothetical protein